MYENFPVARYTFLLKARDNLLLPPFKGSTLRGGFGHAFKRVVCTIKGKPCHECLLYEKCIYSYIFETPPPKDAKIMRKYKAAPHPFVIEPPLEKKSRYLPGEDLVFGLILIGRAIDYLPYFIYTFEELGRIGIGRGRGGFELIQVSVRNVNVKLQNAKGKTSRNLEETENIIYTSESKTLKNDYKTISIEDPLTTLDSSFLTLNFLTPTRIVYNGHLTLDLEFHILIRNLIRRISLLSYFHCNGDPKDFDFKNLIEKAKKMETKERDLSWYDWERYSARQDTRMKMGGFIGRISFEGNLKEFLPYITLGESLHVGKGTTFGLGKYEIMKTL